jgi:hypothetical protein
MKRLVISMMESTPISAPINAEANAVRICTTFLLYEVL